MSLGDLGIGSINGGAIGVKNAIINGNFSVNQRAVSGTVNLAAGVYGHDRWKAGASGCTYTFATVNNVTTLTITAGSLIQVIEGNNLFDGTYTLSWTGTAQGKIGAGSYAGTGVTGAVVGGTDLNIEFNTGTLSLVQFEPGAVATPFERRPYGTELALCQRYFEKTFTSSTAPASNAGVAGSITTSTVSTLPNTNTANWAFKSEKRTSPTVATFNPSAAGSDWYGINTGTSVTASVDGIGTSAITLIVLGSPSDGRRYSIHATADAEL